MTLSMALLIIGVILGAVILVAALKAALGPDDKQHKSGDGGTGVGVSYSHNSRNDENDSDSSSDGGGD